MSDPSTLDLAVIDRRLSRVERDLAELSVRQRPTSLVSKAEDLDADVECLYTAIAARGPLAEHTAKRMFGAQAVAEALRHRLVFRDGSGDTRMLTPDPQAETALARVAAFLEAGPQPMFALREHFNKNTIADVIDRAVVSGLLRRGTLVTGKAGRPQTIVARADQPLPMHWDQWKVEWR